MLGFKKNNMNLCYFYCLLNMVVDRKFLCESIKYFYAAFCTTAQGCDATTAATSTAAGYPNKEPASAACSIGVQ
jgi:hypothetical protein